MELVKLQGLGTKYVLEVSKEEAMSMISHLYKLLDENMAYPETLLKFGARFQVRIEG